MRRRSFLTAAVAGIGGIAAQPSFDRAKLEAARENLARHNTRAFLVVRSGEMLMEWYAPGTTANTKQGTASLAKALVEARRCWWP